MENYSILEWFIFFFYIITSLIAFIGNGFILKVIYSKQMKTTTYVLIGNQAFSDALCGLIYLSLWAICSYKVITFGKSGLLLCEMMTTLKASTYLVSAYTMTLIAIERYLKLYHPLKGGIKIKLSVSLSWGLSLTMGLWTMFYFRNSVFFTPKKLIGCRTSLPIKVAFFENNWNFLISFIIGACLPLSITSYMYYKVVQKIRERDLVGNSVNVQRAQAFEKNKTRTTTMLIMIVVWYFILCAPIYIILIDQRFVSILPEKCDISTNQPFYYSIAYLMAVSSSCINPFIYCFYNRKFREEFVGYFQKLRWWEDKNSGRRKTVETQTLSTNESLSQALDRTSALATPAITVDQHSFNKNI